MTNLQPKKKEGLADQAYKSIKNLILTNQLRPGQFINEQQIQTMLGIGRTPVREAFLRLSRDQLVTIHPRKGIEITRISPKVLHDIFEVRILLEPLILEKSCDIIDAEWLKDMRGKFARYSEAAGEEALPLNAVELAELDDKFHVELMEFFGNQYTTDLMRSFVDCLAIIRSTVTTANHARFQKSNDEHIAIIDCLLSGDVVSAKQKLLDHLNESYNQAVQTLMHLPY